MRNQSTMSDILLHGVSFLLLRKRWPCFYGRGALISLNVVDEEMTRLQAEEKHVSARNKGVNVLVHPVFTARVNWSHLV